MRWKVYTRIIRWEEGRRAHLSRAHSAPSERATTEAARLRLSIRASSPNDGCTFSDA
jgi:hypothetical protein